MSDEFHYGEPARHPARLGRPRARSAGRSIDGRVIWVAAGLVVAGALAFVLLRGADEAGTEIGERQTETVRQIDLAHDAAAKGTVGRAIVVARSIHAEHGTFTIDEETLASYDPSVTFTAGESRGPTVIAYAATDQAFGAAVRSESGTCWWVRTDVDGVTAYGSGTPCTGHAAMGASDPSF